MYPYQTSESGGLDDGGVLGGLLGLARGVGEVVTAIKRPDGVATPPQSQQATKTFVTPSWMPWALGGVTVIVLGALGFLLLRKKP